MKDIVITSRTIKRELFVILGCFLAAFCLNLGAIIHYHHPAVELVSQIGYVVVISVVLYFILWIVRLVVLALLSIFRKR